MKQMGYYPALIFILLLAAGVASAFVVLIMQSQKRIGSYQGSDKSVSQAQMEYDALQANIRTGQEAAKVYAGFFDLWVESEGTLRGPELRKVLQEVAQQTQVTLFEVVATGDTANPSTEPGRTGRSRPMRPARPSEMEDMPMPPGQGMPQGVEDLSATLLGPFPNLLTYLHTLEGRLSSMRILEVSWQARSPEEVKLTLRLHYKPIEKPQL
jgi:hypothetical protein